MKFTSIYFLSAALVLLVISSLSYYYLVDEKNSVNEIIFIESNLDNYRTIPEDKGGLNDPCLNLEVCNMGNE
jgi:hypothetical protein|tara:strand:- start:141 stop:356 length:216 start_codon:yes stop_codon:yes gene_type:complete